MTDSTIQNFRFFSDSLDILIVAIIFFYILKAIEGTRSSQILIGIVAMVILYFTSRKWGFFTLNWVLTHFLGFAILIVIILFQDDIRRGLANIGKKPFLFSFAKHSANENGDRRTGRCLLFSFLKKNWSPDSHRKAGKPQDVSWKTD